MAEMTGTRLVATLITAEMDRVHEGKTTPEQFHYLIDVLERHPFAEKHAEYYPAVRKLFAEVLTGGEE